MNTTSSTGLEITELVLKTQSVEIKSYGTEKLIENMKYVIRNAPIYQMYTFLINQLFSRFCFVVTLEVLSIKISVSFFWWQYY
jgi:hypothetical protein